MDYRLKQIYESMLAGSVDENPTPANTLSSLYEMARPKMPREPKPPKVSKPAPPNATYPEVIAHALFGDPSQTNQIQPPVGKYELGGINQVLPQDLQTFKQLYSVNPPKKGMEIGTAATKGSGNGEIALFWLLRQSYPDIEDGREGGDPDLKIPSLKIGVEVKAYGGDKMITLGRFGDQHVNRRLLSVVFGLKALVENFDPRTPSRMPSLDTFNSKELASAFDVLAKFDSNEALRRSGFNLLHDVYKQIDQVKNALNLGSEPGSFTEKDIQVGAGRMMLAFLKDKLREKPGFGGYLVNITEAGKIDWKQIPTEDVVDDVLGNNPERVLKYVTANGASLKANFDQLFFSGK